MKKENNNIWLLSLSFLAGSLISYIFCQFQYLQIDIAVNVTESILSIITAIIGLYIAISLQKKYTKNQNKHSFVQSKLDSSWQSFSNFSQNLHYQDFIEVSQVTKFIKEINLSTNFIKHIFTPWGLNTICIDELDALIDNLEQLIGGCPTANNIYSISTKKVEIAEQIKLISKKYADLMKQIH